MKFNLFKLLKKETITLNTENELLGKIFWDLWKEVNIISELYFADPLPKFKPIKINISVQKENKQFNGSKLVSVIDGCCKEYHTKREFDIVLFLNYEPNMSFYLNGQKLLITFVHELVHIRDSLCKHEFNYSLEYAKRPQELRAYKISRYFASRRHYILKVADKIYEDLLGDVK